jgi:glucosamine kinase
VAYYLGIDGGGSKTSCAVADENAPLAVATAGPSNVVRVGEAQARESLHQCVLQACATAGITPPQVARTCVGAAGAARVQIDAIIRRILAEILPSPVDVVGDANIALAAAFGSGPGVIVIAGTGSIAYGRAGNGVTARAGGWGFAISDEGSAHWVGRIAIGTALRGLDLPASDLPEGSSGARTGEANSLLGALMKSWGISSVDDLVRAANSTPAPDFATLFPAVVSASAMGDEVARSVLGRAGAELAKVAGMVVHRLFPSGSASPVTESVVPVAMAGGVFRHAAIVREVFYNEIRRLDSRAVVNEKIADPVEGALRLAREAAAKV